MYEQLEEVKKSCLNCQKCALGALRNNVVFSDGIPNSKLMLIGEAPGFNEDMQGKPFVGRAGQLLDKIFESVGFSREKDVYICNTIKCRPPENRDPLPDEKEACRAYLDKQIEILKPRIILLCGKVALTSFLPHLNVGITKVRGQWFEGPYGAKMMPIFHPSYLLRNPIARPGSPKALMWEDIKNIRKAYDAL
ncbi:MAG: uracil-DNA glycosylase [Alphaproteobacteria bacterium]|nr:uracil-DNA glycosylase [Alphaproteobacteria bacterium]MBQ6854713.1 uracil-DNA glycosylase [Alphaproteobacteria bacterium]MBQ8558125.1 uracil-DNA glycosylase [Alphaproteobacteria bacterium]MBR3912676.1 uracil-DNA glycosylase [Alphaproteobacteria bacterium]MBR4931821.1 uracil-DNA glycosylase [Alphaproteobacteria bacterium]